MPASRKNRPPFSRPGPGRESASPRLREGLFADPKPEEDVARPEKSRKVKFPDLGEAVREPGDADPSVEAAKGEPPLGELEADAAVEGYRRVIALQKPVRPAPSPGGRKFLISPEKIQEQNGKMVPVGRVGEGAGVGEVRRNAFYLGPVAGDAV